MKKTVMMKKKYEFKRLFTKGQIYYGRNITTYLLKNQYSFNKFGIAIGKKSGKAVDRNRIKRLIRENYKLLEDNIKSGYHILISVNKKCEIKNVDFYDIKKDMEKEFKKSELWIEES